MNDAGNNHSTRLSWVRSLLPDDDGNLTPAQAIRRYGPPELVAEMDRLVELETARLFPPPPPRRPPGETEWDRHVVELIRQYPGAPEKVTAELNRRMAEPDHHEREWKLELARVGTTSELSDCLSELWRHLKAEGMAGRLPFSYQPTDPAAARVTIAPDRCRYLTVQSPGTLFEGALAIALYCGPAMPDTLWLDGHELRHARVGAASEEVAIRARLANLKRAPTDDEAKALAVELNTSHRAVIRIIQDIWPKRKVGRRKKPTVVGT